jgi:SHS2 domain-containing protein
LYQVLFVVKSRGSEEYNRIMGFEEVSHTADWSARVWAPDLPSLFREAARAMNSLSGTVIGTGDRVSRTLEVEGPDVESLLVAFLSELVYYQEQENLTFDSFDLRVAGQWLKVAMEGAEIESMDKAIKAVTYHNLKIATTPEGLETTIVFDV